MNCKTKQILSATSLVVLASSLAYAGAEGGTYKLMPYNPMPVSTVETEWFKYNGGVASPVAGGHHSNPAEAPTAKDAIGNSIYIFQSASIGKIFSEEQDDFCVGDFCTYLPVESGNINWDATIKNIRESQSYKDGRLEVFPKEEDPLQRILFTREGVCDVEWVLASGSTQPTAYVIGIDVEKRPHKLYWTEEPFNGPRVSVNDRFVRLLGHPDIVKPTYYVDEKSGVTNITRGVYIDVNSKTVVAKAHENGDGPKGQFVVAYFDSGYYDNLIGLSVVEVSGPDPLYQNYFIGDIVRPTGGGYDIDGLSAIVKKGLNEEMDDEKTPYLFQFSSATAGNEKDKNIYGISETAEGELGAGKVNIYWQYPDKNDVSWPFENIVYDLDWPEDALTVVCGSKNGDKGSGILYSSEYMVTLLKEDPEGIALVDEQEKKVNLNGKGRIVLSFTTMDGGVWVIPFNVKCNEDYDRQICDWNIGSELKPFRDSADTFSRAAAEKADFEFPGYVFGFGSTNSMLNLNLYHEPVSKLIGPAEDNQQEDIEEINPLEKLKSSIYFVNKSDSSSGDEVEVWWFDLYTQENMPYPIAYPVVSQKYRPVWPNIDDTYDIAISSEKGSSAVSAGTSGKALYLVSTNSIMTVQNVEFLKTDNSCVGFWVNVSPDQAELSVAPKPGTILSLPCTNNCSIVASLVEAQTDYSIEFSYVNENKEKTILESFAISTDQWVHFFASFEDTVEGKSKVRFVKGFSVNDSIHSVNSLLDAAKISIGANAELSLASATDVAIDDVTIQYGNVVDIMNYLKTEASSLDEGIIVNRNLSFNLNFEGNLFGVNKNEMNCYATDAIGGMVAAGKNIYSIEPGAISFQKNSIPYNDEIEPRIYVQNNLEIDGYNPNEEHAILLYENGEYVAYALRNDLNTANSSEPFVLVEYNDNGKGAMKIYNVVVTNEFYPELKKEVIAGNLISGPHPFPKLDGFNNERNLALSQSAEADSNPVYYDRLNRMWARRDGRFEQFFYYPVQEDFAFPGVEKKEAIPALGTLVPWMPEQPYVGNNLTQGIPKAWSWTSVWPDELGVPTMYVAQTLTKAINGLPEVWNASSIGVAYPAKVLGTNINKVVELIDPTVAQYSSLEIENDFLAEYGFTVGSSGTARLRSGKYYIQGLPPTISDRFYIDTTLPTNSNMVLVGKLVEPTGGTSYLQVNVLSKHERDALKAACRLGNDNKNKLKWDAAIDALAVTNVLPATQLKRSCVFNEQTPGYSNVIALVTNNQVGVCNAYIPKDHYGLVATGEGCGWVSIIENDGPTENGMVNEGNPINMHLIRVVPELYTAPLVVLEDPNNKLSEQLDILYTAPFGNSATNFVFEWKKIEPPADGSVPENYPEWITSHSGDGKTEIHLGAAASSLVELSNTYFVMHYKAKSGTKVATTVGDEWSGWCGPTLAEGWIQRVFNTITPFAQRLDDFYENATELSLSMPEQIGAPYNGDIALNMENLNEVGLLQLYHTVLNKAESMSLSINETSLAANKQLLLAVSRMADLYALLGAEAYSDAKNPTVTVGSEALPSSVFCFANQLPSLLDEELALLRGRTHTIAPNTSTYPYYNRLIWNFTKGITEGEMAYVNNYQIHGTDGVITAEQAAKQYPQGHGDAYGHYLSAVKLYYRLLRNPVYYWGEPSMMEMLVNDSIVNMDYEDEQKFADAAAKLAQTGIDVVDLTARKQWRDEKTDMGSGYFDNYSATPAVNSTNKVDQAFGYGEWAVRTGLGAFYNWATANSLVPADSTNAVYYFQDDSIGDIVRETIPSLNYLADAVKTVGDKVNRMDAGMNPLGLSDNAVPFDINPLELEYINSHYDQILNRAKKALNNAQTVLDYAQQFGSRIAQLSETEADFASEFETIEQGYIKELISIFGTPYSGDIGPGGTYPQGYNGPDVFHYMWMDLGEYGLDSMDLTVVTNVTSRAYMSRLPYTYDDFDVNVNNDYVVPVSYDITTGGIIKKPDNIKGTRLAEGSVQAAYRDFLFAYDAARKAQVTYLGAAGAFEKSANHLKSKFAREQTKLAMTESLLALTAVDLGNTLMLDMNIGMLQWVLKTQKDLAEITIKSTPTIVGAGLTVNTDPAAVVNGIATTAQQIADHSIGKAIRILQSAKAIEKMVLGETEVAVKGISAGLAYMDVQKAMFTEFNNLVGGVNNAANNLTTAILKLSKAEEMFKAEVEKGMLILEEREMIRKQQSNKATALRYADMYYRVQRNNALSKYNAAFDVAQRYVFELAKVYDYETGLLSSDPQAGDTFLNEIIATRALGQEGVSIIPACTDGGLWDVVNRMSANWDVLKGRLGVNNPTKTTKWFSLRYSLFRIDPGASGDAAWEQELRKYWVDDINAHSEFSRYCQPPADSTGVAKPEPGLIIPFSTSINVAENFFGKTLSGEEATFSSSDYATKIYQSAVYFEGYNERINGWEGLGALADSPNIYLVPVGMDKMRSPAGITRKVLGFNVVDQVMPLPYTVGSAELDDEDWVASFSGLDGTTDSFATIRRHSTLPEGQATVSSRLAGRSVWNTRWLLVIPGSSLLGDREKGLDIFIHGADINGDGIADQRPVRDIKLGLRTYSRQGN